MRILNLLIPCETGDEETLPSEEAKLPPDLSDGELDFVERELRAAQEQEEERDRSVHARLIALLGLSSLVTALLSGLTALVTTSDLNWPLLILVAVLVASAYVALQAMSAMLFTIRGLMPKVYVVLLPWEDSQNLSAWQRSHRLSGHITNLRQSVYSTNRRVDDMVLALRSLKRLAVGSALLFVVLVVTILDQRTDGIVDVQEPPVEPADTDLVPEAADTELAPASRATPHR